MKIGMIASEIDLSEVGGASVRLLDRVNKFAICGHQVILITQNGLNKKFDFPASVKHLFPKTSVQRRSSLFFKFFYALKTELYAYRALKRFLCEDRIDLIYERLQVISFTPFFLRSEFNIPIVLEAHSTRISGLKFLYAAVFTLFPFLEYLLKRVFIYLLSSSDCVIVKTDNLKRIFSNWGIPEKKIVVIYNGVDTDLMHPREKSWDIIEKYDLTNQRVLTYISSFAPYHGHLRILNAMKKVLETRKDVKLLFVGATGDLFAEIKKEVEQLGLRDYVVFTGLVLHSDIPKILSVTDITFVVYHDDYPFLRERGFSEVKLFECMASGVPIIASDFKGGNSVFVQNHTGFLVNTNDARKFSDAILNILDNTELARIVAKNARDECLKKFSLNVIIKQYLQVFTETISNACAHTQLHSPAFGPRAHKIDQNVET